MYVIIAFCTEMWMSDLIFADCGCNKEGSANDACDQTSGQCSCKPERYGRTCNEGKLKSNKSYITLIKNHKKTILIKICKCNDFPKSIV